jgi:hypothetical protein
MSDGTIAGADSSPLIAISVVVLQYHPVYAKVILFLLPAQYRYIEQNFLGPTSLCRDSSTGSIEQIACQQIVSDTLGARFKLPKVQDARICVYYGCNKRAL